MWSSYCNLRLFYFSNPWFLFYDVDSHKLIVLCLILFLLKIVVPESWIASNLMNCQWHGSDWSTIIQHSYNHLEVLSNASQWSSVPRNTLPATVTSPGLRPAAGSKQSEARRGTQHICFISAQVPQILKCVFQCWKYEVGPFIRITHLSISTLDIYL